LLGLCDDGVVVGVILQIRETEFLNLLVTEDVSFPGDDASTTDSRMTPHVPASIWKLVDVGLRHLRHVILLSLCVSVVHSRSCPQEEAPGVAASQERPGYGP